jgi:hypothetical protein
MSSYFSLNFTGSFTSLQKLFDSREWKYEIKQISNNKAFLKTSDEISEEIKYFANTTNETYNVKYENVTIFLFRLFQLPNVSIIQSKRMVLK